MNPSNHSEEDNYKSDVTFAVLLRNLWQIDEQILKGRLEDIFQEKNIGLTTAGEAGTTILFVNTSQAEIRYYCLAVPYPEQLARQTLSVCHFSQAHKEIFYSSKAHVIVSIEPVNDEMPVHEQMQLLYNVLTALNQLYEDNIIGVIHESAMTAHPAYMLADYLNTKAEFALARFPFPAWLMWTGALVKYILPDNEHIWFVTKGNHRFGLPEFAYRGKYDEGNTTVEMFYLIFSYAYLGNETILPNHTMEIGGRFIKFISPYEYEEHITGKYGTLVIE